MTPQEMRELRAKAVHDARAILERAEAEGRPMTSEEDANYSKAFDDATNLKKRIDQAEKLAQLEAEEANEIDLAAQARRESAGTRRLSELVDPATAVEATLEEQGLALLREQFGDVEQGEAGWNVREQLRATPAFRRAFWKEMLLKHGATGADGELVGRVRADLVSDSAVDGGYLNTPMEFTGGLLKALEEALPLRSFFRTFRVRGADSLGVRRRTAKASTYARGGEITPPTPDKSLKFGIKTLTPHFYTAEIFLSRDLIRRAVMPVESIAIDEVTRDVAEKQEDEWIAGNGSQEPLGLFTPSTDGISTARDSECGSAAGAAYNFDDLRDAKYTVFRYWNNARWIFPLDGEKEISKIKDGDGQYIWQRDVRVGEPDRLLGLPVHVHERFPSDFSTAGNYTGMVGDFSYYWVAESLDMEVLRLSELYAEINQVALLFRGKNDGMPILEEPFARLKLKA